MVNIKDIAKAAGVSPATVSNVFTGNKRVARETRARVLDVCRRLNYVPSVMASGNITKRTNIIGLFFDIGNDTYHDLYAGLIKGVMLKAAETGRRVLLYWGIENTRELNSILRAGCHPIDAALLFLPRLRDERMDTLSKESIPYLLLGNPGKDDADTSFIDMDNVDLGYRAAMHYIAKGHRNIGMINYKTGYRVTTDRQTGYQKALFDSRILYDPQMTVYGDVLEETGYNGAKKLLMHNPATSVIFTPMPVVAKGVFAALKELHLSPLRDVSVLCFSGMVPADMPYLSFVDTDYENLGRQGVEALIRLIEQPDTVIQRYVDADITFTGDGE